LGQFTAGEEFCRQAIAANPNYSNGYKNLGLALVGQGRLREAAESFANAIRVTPGDPRSLYHLKALLRENPVLIPDYEGIVQNGEQAYQSAINQ
jgi:tetratricopeptide (TPR) repeat protein